MTAEEQLRRVHERLDVMNSAHSQTREQIAGHIASCDERYKRFIDKLDGLTGSMDGLRQSLEANVEKLIKRADTDKAEVLAKINPVVRAHVKSGVMAEIRDKWWAVMLAGVGMLIGVSSLTWSIIATFIR